jgi:DNA-binding transcriptional LysR family regulator
MDLRQLRVFIAAADSLNFARAAESLGIAQPAVSQHIKTLESFFGFQLFHRIRRGVELTPAGHALLPEARATVMQSEKALRVASRAHIGEIGRLHIAYVHSVMLEPELPRLIRLYRTAAPDVTLEFSDISMVQQIEMLTEQRVDVAFVRAPTHALPREVVSRRFSSARLFVALPSDHRLSPRPTLSLSDLKDEAFILLQDPHGLGLGHHIMELCEAAGFTPRSELTLQNLTVAVGLVAAGLGVSIVPEAVARTAPPGVACRLLDMEAATSQVCILHKAGVPPPVLAQFLSLANWPAIVRRADSALS